MFDFEINREVYEKLKSKVTLEVLKYEDFTTVKDNYTNLSAEFILSVTPNDEFGEDGDTITFIQAVEDTFHYKIKYGSEV